MKPDPKSESITIKRTYAATRERIFQVWTTPKYIARWLRPDKNWEHPFIEFDAHVGGCFRIGFQGPDGTSLVVRGTFLEVDAPNRIAYTWMWEEPDPHAGIESRVTVELTECDGGTELKLTHDRLADAGMADRHREGWIGSLGQFAAAMAPLNL